MEDFIPVYEDSNDPDIQTIITDKFEFLIKNGKLREEEPIRGQTYSHQQFFQRYMMFNDIVFLMDEGGTGKSCKFINLANFYKTFNNIYKKAVIIEKGATTKNEMKNQIIYKCSPEGMYETDTIKNASTDISRKRAETVEVKKWFDLETYGSYVKPSFTMTDEQIRAHYDYSIIFLDEAHNLKRGNDIRKNDNNDEDIDKIYDAMWRIFHVIKHSKIVVASATMMVNDVNEVAKMMNLILPDDFQMPLSWDYRKVVFSQMEPFFRGKLMYIRALDTGAVPVYKGEKIDRVYTIKVPDPKWKPPPYERGQKQPEPPMIDKKVHSQIICYPTYMEGIQEDTYINTVKNYKNTLGNDDEIEDEIEDREEIAEHSNSNKRAFWIAARQAASFVYPDGSYGGKFERLLSNKEKNRNVEPKGLGKYVISEKQNVFGPTKEFKIWLTDMDKLKELSSKAAEIVKIETENTGCSYIYSDFISGSGIFVIGQALEANGFERFTSTSSVFEYVIDSNGKRVKKIKSSFKKKKRYVMLSSDTPDSLRDSLMELRQSDENVYGEYLQSLLTSPTGKEGINDRHGVRIIMVVAPWTIASTHQAEWRSFRSTSHTLLIELEKEKFLKLADRAKTEEERKMYIEKSKNVKIEVSIYRLVALSDAVDSIDLKIYQHSELKNLYIQRMMNFAIRSTVDARINYERNVRVTDEDYSVACNYMKCGYKPSSAITLPTKSEIDYSTFDIYYADDVLNMIIPKIEKEIIKNGYVKISHLIELFGDNNKDDDVIYETVDELKRSVLKKFRHKNIYMAVEKILRENKTITNRFGYTCYYYLQNDILFLSSTIIQNKISCENYHDLKIIRRKKKDVCSNNFSSPAIYSNKLIYVEPLNFEEILNIELNPNYEKIIVKLKSLDLDKDTNLLFNVYLSQLNIHNKVKLLEDALIDYANNGKNEITKFNKKILKEFSTYVAIIHEPTQDIENAAKGKIDKYYEFIGPEKDSVNIYLHSLQTIKEHYTKYDVSSSFLNVEGTIRIYKKSEAKFRDTNKNETPAYRDFVIKQRKQFFENYFKTSNVFGTRLGDDIFRINIKSENATEKSQYKGKICESLPKGALLQIIYDENIIAPDMIDIAELDDEEIYNMRNYLRELKDLKSYFNFDEVEDYDIVSLYKWYTLKSSKELMCNYIEQEFKNKNKLMII